MQQDDYIFLVQKLRDFFTEQGFSSAVLGLSGGIDSALTLKIAVDALGSSNVVALMMPYLGLSSRENVEHAIMLCEAFGVEYFKVPINKFVKEYEFLPWNKDDSSLAMQNVKARVRANILYHYANDHNCLVLGTSNLSEIKLGYGTKFGDLAADVEVLGSFYKTEVRAMAKLVGLPDVFINKPPTAELYAGQTDELELGADYAVLDTILQLGEGGSTVLIKRVLNRVKKNRHKSEMPYILPKSE